jgi:hypothetical protein
MQLGVENNLLKFRRRLLKLSPQDYLRFAASQGWEASARAFVNNISDVRAEFGSGPQLTPERPQLAT